MFIDTPDNDFIKLIGDKYFNQRSLKDILHDYKTDERTKNGKDNDGKNLKKVIVSNVINTGLDEKQFIDYLSEDIYKYENLENFAATLSNLLS